MKTYNAVIWALIIGTVFSMLGYWITPKLVVLGPVAFVLSLLIIIERISKNS